MSQDLSPNHPPTVEPEERWRFGDAPELEVLSHFNTAWQLSQSGARLAAIQHTAGELNREFSSGPRVLAVRSLPITTLVYPTKYAFWSAALLPFPYVIMKHQCLLVQFLQGGELKHLLFNPTDAIAARETPFFKRLVAQVGEAIAYRILQKQFKPLEAQLAELGLSTKHIDYIAFDHFHTQDLRGLLGTEDGSSARFPNAKLLAPRREWEDWDTLHPLQRAWFIADGKSGVRTQNVVLTDEDLVLGSGVLLVRTPGHTSGNQTLFLNTERGVWGCSENGTCADNWSPISSKIPGIAQFCRQHDVDILINANTPELGEAQYTSMVLERNLVSRVSHAPAFVCMFPSSEVQPSYLAPGIKPTVLHGALNIGELVRPAYTEPREASAAISVNGSRKRAPRAV